LNVNLLGTDHFGLLRLMWRRKLRPCRPLRRKLLVPAGGCLRGKRSGCICESGQIRPFRPSVFRFIPIFPAATVMLFAQLEKLAL
jgi:hypothetical protein